MNLAGVERTSWAMSAGIGPDRRGGNGSAMQDISDLRGRWNAEGVLRPKRDGAATKEERLLLLLPALRSYGLKTNSKDVSTCERAT